MIIKKLLTKIKFKLININFHIKYIPILYFNIWRKSSQVNPFESQAEIISIYSVIHLWLKILRIVAIKLIYIF